MPSKSNAKQPIALLKNSITTLFTHKEILFPFVLLACFQLFVFELLLFAPRYPLVKIFGPLISRLEGPVFLHYPFNYFILAKWFEGARLQGAIFIFISSFLIGTAVAVINLINNGQPVFLKAVFKRALGAYPHLLLAAALPILTMQGVTHLHRMVLARAMEIRSAAGKFYLIKQAVLLSAPYVNLVAAVLVTTFFIFIIPIIIIEKKGFFSALIFNFRTLWRNFWFSFFVLLLPALLYVPVILLNLVSPLYRDNIPPEMLGVIAVGGILVSILIDAIHYMTMTTFYLLTKEEK